MFRTVVAPVSSQEAHIRRVDAQLDHRQDVAAFDRDFVRGDVGLRARSNWAEDAHESHPETTGKRHTAMPNRMPREQRGADRSRVREVGARDGDCP